MRKRSLILFSFIRVLRGKLEKKSFRKRNGHKSIGTAYQENEIKFGLEKIVQFIFSSFFCSFYMRCRDDECIFTKKKKREEEEEKCFEMEFRDPSLLPYGQSFDHGGDQADHSWIFFLTRSFVSISEILKKREVKADCGKLRKREKEKKRKKPRSFGYMNITLPIKME